MIGTQLPLLVAGVSVLGISEHQKCENGLAVFLICIGSAVVLSWPTMHESFVRGGLLTFAGWIYEPAEFCKSVLFVDGCLP